MESENVTRAEEKEKEEGLQKMAMEHETIRVENSVLSRHLARLVTWKQSDVHLKLGVLEEDAEVMEDTSDSLRSSSSKNLKLVQGSIDASGRQSLRLRSFSTESQDMPTSTKELSKFAAGTMAPPLSLEEKCDIVEDENTVLHEQMERTRSENERVLDDLQAVLDETEQCVAEVRKEKSDLKREVLQDAQMNGLTKPCTETVLRFVKAKFKSKCRFIEKLQEKNIMLQKQILEAENRFASKKDLRDVLHAVDFDQINIQNQQLGMKIQDHDAELQSLKADSKKVAQALDAMRLQLNDSVEEARHLKQCLLEHAPQLSNVKEQIITVSKQKKKLEEMLPISMHQGDGPPLPEVLDYMQVKNKLGFLKKEVHTWQKKVEIVELMAQQLEKHVKVIRKKLYTPASCHSIFDQTQVTA